MSIYGAMFSGVSGLAAQSQALGMISDNISNINTVGYKQTDAQFHTLVTETGSTSQYAPGGVRSMPLQRIDKQGLLQNSSSPTDLAIVGNGFFVVNESAQPTANDTYLYTRAGGFTTDQFGNLVTSGGYYLQGWPLDDTGTLPANTTQLTGLQTVHISNLTGTAKATSTVNLALNLPAQDAVNATEGTTIPIFDKQGATQTLDLTWTKTAVNTWTLSGSLPATGMFASDDTPGATLTDTLDLATVVFNADGTIGSITAINATVDANNRINFYADYDADATTVSTEDRQLMSLNIGDLSAPDGVTQFAGDFFTSKIEQNGLTFGAFTGVSIDQRGVVTAVFDNGQRRDIYQLPIATFSNPNGLLAQNGNAYLETNASGSVQLKEANAGGAGVISPSSLEASNVDLAEQFANMIITQRAYSADAKVITTADQMLEELINIRR